jgi:hypothetical protein
VRRDKGRQLHTSYLYTFSRALRATWSNRCLLVAQQSDHAANLRINKIIPLLDQSKGSSSVRHLVTVGFCVQETRQPSADSKYDNQTLRPGGFNLDLIAEIGSTRVSVLD